MAGMLRIGQGSAFAPDRFAAMPWNRRLCFSRRVFWGNGARKGAHRGDGRWALTADDGWPSYGRMRKPPLPLIPIAAMISIVAASNHLVQFPINDWLTWGAITYPLSFLVTDLTTRLSGPVRARRVVYVGFALAVILSIWLATPRIALASGTAFLAGQLLDIQIFQRLRQGSWWRAPLASSTAGSILDTGLFFTLAFAGTGLPLVTLALGDLAVKLALALLFLAPFRAVLGLALRPSPASP
jgi:queuosine precursor transporter